MDTNNRIKELTDKIHREGLEKANRDADEIIEKARKEAEQIISKAGDEADSIIRSAKKEAEKLSHKIKSDVRLSSQQAIANLRKEISELVQASVMKEPIDEAFNDSSFVSGLLETMVKNWNPCEGEAELQVLLPKGKLKIVENYFRQKSGHVLNRGLSLKEYNGSGNGFEIRPKNGHYKISMTDEAFDRFLKEHFKSQTLEFLYGSKS
ncbi:MAG: V-type ATP synthase subunit E family protein [Bacteroidota bacterium]